MFDTGYKQFDNTVLDNVKMTPQITILDAVMGTGKSRGIIDMFNGMVKEDTQFSKPYLIILPYLREIERYMLACPGMDFSEPLSDKAKAKMEIPRKPNGATKKKEDLRLLLLDGSNILTTHSMFDMWDDDIALLVRDSDYHVIIDEEVGSMKNLSIKLTPGDRKELIKLEYMTVDADTKQVYWDFEASDDTDGKYTGNVKYEKIRNHCKSGNLYIYGDLADKSIPFFIWTIPMQFFRVAQSYTILTYRFEFSELSAFFKLNGIKYTTEHPNMDRQLKILRGAKKLITFIDAPKSVLKACNPKNALSHSWYSRCQKAAMIKLGTSIGDSLSKTHKVDAEQVMWTCPSTYAVPEDRKGKSHMGIKGYLDQHVPWNCKGTNDYAERDVIVYMSNVYPNVGVVKYLKEKGIDFDQDSFALSSMLQFIWRSAIRDDALIQVMVPNQRMRNLLKEWVKDA